MRRTVAVLLGAAALAAGCSSAGDDPAPLGVTTPPASATVGPTGTAAPTGTSAPTSRPAPAPTPTGTPAPSASGPRAAYASLAADWQLARSRFFTAVSDGTRRTVAQQRALATAYLAASRRFATGLREATWPAKAQPAVRELLAANAAQQIRLKAMSTAASAGAFTGHLADYGVGAARENRAVAAVAAALGG